MRKVRGIEVVRLSIVLLFHFTQKHVIDLCVQSLHTFKLMRYEGLAYITRGPSNEVYSVYLTIKFWIAVLGSYLAACK